MEDFILQMHEEYSRREVTFGWVFGWIVTTASSIALACVLGWLGWDFWKYKAKDRT